MSAWVVSNRHINIIVSAACLPEAMSQKLGKLLLAENINSVAYRYRLAEKSPERLQQRRQLAAYRFVREAQPHGAVLKAAECLDYQSCEHDDWAGCEAQFFLSGLMATLEAYRDTDSHRAAPWGFED